jgi:hypothetical protein
MSITWYTSAKTWPRSAVLQSNWPNVYHSHSREQNSISVNVTTTYRVSIKSFPDYKHLLQENYVEYKLFFLPLLKLVSKISCHLHYILKKKNACIPRRFLLINVCNQWKILCSPCICYCLWSHISALDVGPFSGHKHIQKTSTDTRLLRQAKWHYGQHLQCLDFKLSPCSECCIFSSG